MAVVLARPAAVTIRAASSVSRCSRSHLLRIRAANRAFGGTPGRRQESKKYTEDHEWVQFQAGSNEIARIGISAYAAKALGDVVYVELPETGMEVSKGDSIGAVESVKSASDIMTPVSGTIQEVNSALSERPSIINSSPEKDGWLATITVRESKELDDLMDEEGYRKFTDEVEKK